MSRFPALSALLVLALLAGGCGSGFSRHYQGQDLTARPDPAIQKCTTPQVETLPASVLEQRAAEALSRGYVRLGRATWESAVPAKAEDAAAQARHIGACLVLQSVTPIPQEPEKPHYRPHPGFVSRMGQRGIFAEDNSGLLDQHPAVRYRNDAIFLARTQ